MALRSESTKLCSLENSDKRRGETHENWLTSKASLTQDSARAGLFDSLVHCYIHCI